jgi:glycolate dehydrogenase FAD-binding subunit
MRAASEAEVVDAVREARGRKMALEIVGNGTKRAFGRPCEGEVLDVSDLAGIVVYEPEELILTAKPGTTLREVNAALDAKGQQLGFDPPAWARLFGGGGEATLGGAIGVDAGGPQRLRYGGARDHLLGIRAVNGMAEAFKAGGRVVKNVTGFDVPKLVCGAFGTLCVLTEVTVRVFPKPALSKALGVREIAPEPALALLRRVWSSPLESSGLSYEPSSAALGTALFRVDGAAAPLEEKLALLRTLLAGHDVVAVADDETAFARIGEGEAFADSAVDVWRVYVPPAQAWALVRAVEPVSWLADWAGGLLWLGLPSADADAVLRLRSALATCGAQARLMRAAPETRARYGIVHPDEEGVRDLMHAVKTAFDPDHLFNRDRMIERL